MRRSRNGLLALGLVTVLALPACSPAAAATSKVGDYKVEVFSSWTGPGEQEGLDALVEDFNNKNPGIEFVNAAISGGGGANAKSVLTTRLQANDPPDSYQAHAGLELTEDIRSGQLEDLSYLYDRQGWRDKFPQPLMEALTVNGRIYSVPVDIHRTNLIWYNPKTLAAAGIAGPPKTWDEFLAQISVWRSRNITPLAIGPLWTEKLLLENVMLGTLGPDGYKGLFTGKTDWLARDFRDKAMNPFALVMRQGTDRYLDQTESGDWQPALDKVINGKAAYIVMGDWALAYLSKVKGLTYKVDYDVAPAPGTAGIYNFMSDVFTLPKNAQHRGAAEKWLIECGSEEGQDVFSPQRGSIPARTDASTAKYAGYLAAAMGDWRDPDTKIVGSLTYGVVANSAWNAEIDKALAALYPSLDLDTFAQSVAQAYKATKQ